MGRNIGMALTIDDKQFGFEDFEEILEQCKGLDYAKEAANFLKEWFSDSDHVEIPTSGSTGIPKLQRFLKISMLKSAEKSAAHFGFAPGQKALLALPVKYVAGKMMLVRAIVSDLELEVAEPSAVPLVEGHNGWDFIPLTVYQFQKTYQSDPALFTNVRKVLLGGGPVTSEVEAYCKKISTMVYHGFGMTETLTHIAVKNVSKEEESYTALPGVTFSLSLGGTLDIHTDHLPEKVCTTDCAELISDKQFRWLGRSDNIINTGGVKINPELVEDKLKRLINEPFFITGIADSELGERVVLVIESQYPVEYAVSQLRDILEPYERPKEIFISKAFEMTETGKIKRKESLLKVLKNN